MDVDTFEEKGFEMIDMEEQTMLMEDSQQDEDIVTNLGLNQLEESMEAWGRMLTNKTK